MQIAECWCESVNISPTLHTTVTLKDALIGGEHEIDFPIKQPSFVLSDVGQPLIKSDFAPIQRNFISELQTSTECTFDRFSSSSKSVLT